LLSRTTRRALTVLLGLSLPVVGISTLGGVTAHAAGNALFTETFRNNSVPDPHWVIGGSNFTPCLTAAGNSTIPPIKSCVGTADTAGNGAVRLTNASTNESGFLFYNQPLPATAGIDVTFDTFQYSGTGADGIAFFLTDGQYQLLAPGQPGGYLGYAGGAHGIGTGNGVAHALLGVGLDAWGNFSNFENSPAGGGGNCSNAHTPSFVPNAVVLRGAGNADESNYCYLAGAASPSPLHLDSATTRTNGGLNNVARRVHIVVDPSSAPSPKVTVSIDGIQVLQTAEPPMSPTVKFGWTASTGGSTNIHEIQNVTAATINPLAPSLSVTNTVNNGGSFVSGAGASGDAAYTITADVNANFETQPFTLTVPLPAGLGYTSTSSADPNMSCAASSATLLSCTYTPTGYGFAPGQSVTAHLLFSPTAAYSHKDLLLTASVSSPDGGSPTASQTLQVDPMVVPSAITTTVNVPATVAQGAHGTAPFTWNVGAGTWNPAVLSSATVDASGKLTVTPVAGASGTTTVQLSIQDPSGALSAATNVPVTVQPTVSAVAGAGPGPAPVYANVPAPVGTGPFAYSLVTTPDAVTQGTAQFVAGSPEQVKFTPVQGFSGLVPAFTYRVTDAAGVQSAPATVGITVNEPLPPAVVAVSGAIDANTTFTQTVPAPTGAAPFAYGISTPPPSGTETVSSAGVLRFTPPSNASGTFNSAYQVLDQYGQPSNSGAVQVTVRPVAADFSGSTVGTLPLTLNAPPPAGTGAFTWTAAPPQTNGILSMNIVSGQVTFTAHLGYTGTFSFPYTVSDGVGTSSTGKSVTITVVAPPAPAAVAYGSTQDADTLVAAQLPAPASGTGPFTYSTVTAPPAGTLVLQSNGSFSYTPAAGTSGVVTFTYRVTDPYGSVSAPATVTLNFRPVALGVSGSTVGPQPVTLPAASVDGTGPLTYVLTQPPAAQGTASVNQANGVITFTPLLGVTGLVAFSYTATGAGPTTSLPAAVLVLVTAPAPPVANLVVGTTVSGGSTSLTASTSSGVGPFTYVISGPPSHGTATLGVGNQLDYTSTAPYSGIDAFVYAAIDAYGTSSAPAVAMVAVHPIAASPVNGSSTGPAAVIAMPGSPTGTGPFTYTLVPASLPPLSKGTTIEDSSGQITFTPVIGFSGAVSFQYIVTDNSNLKSAPGAVDFTVNKPSGPGVTPASGTTPANTPVDVTLPAPTGTAPLTYQISSPPTLGIATISAAGVVHYLPNANVSGVDTLQYTVTDPYLQTSAPATVTIAVTPTVQDVNATMTANTSLTLPTPPPAGTGPFTYTVTTPSDGLATVSSAGVISYTPAHNFGGVDYFTYQATDAQDQASNAGAVTITVNKPPLPTVADVSATIDANTTLTQTVPAPTGTGPFAYSISTPPTLGTEAISSAGVLTFTPPGNASGVYTSTYQVVDPYGQPSNAGNITLTVRPVAADFSGSTVGTSPLTLNAPLPAGTGVFTWAAAPPQTNGTLSMDAGSGQVTFTATLGYAGPFNFPYSVSDGVGTSSTAKLVTITVVAPPAPVAVAYSSTQDAGTLVAAQLQVPASGTGPFTYATVTGPASGALALQPNGHFSFTPGPGTSGVVTFTYHVTDPYDSASAPATVTLDFRPVALAVSGSTVGPQQVTLPAASVDGTGPFTYVLTPPSAAQGTATVDQANGEISFTPLLGFTGDATFSYTATGAGAMTSLPAAVTVTVTAPSAPAVADVSATIDANTTLTQTVPAPTGTGPFTYSISTPPTTGTEAISSAGVLTFTPPGNASGVYTSAYQVADPYGQPSNSGAIQVTVLPLAADFSGHTRGTALMTLPAPGPTGTAPFTWVSTPPQTDGTLSMDAASGQVTFTANLAYTGTFSFPYSVSDGVDTSSATQSVTITVVAPLAPVAVTYGRTQDAGTLVVAQLPAPASGTGPFTYSTVTAPGSGSLALLTDGHFSLTPVAGTSGIVRFTYQVTDPYGTVSAAAEVTLDFSPLAEDLSGSTVSPHPVTLAAPAVVGSGPFTYTLASPPAADGAASVNQANGVITFTPKAGYWGPVTFSYTVTGAGPTTSRSAQVFVLVTRPAAQPRSHITATAATPQAPDSGAHLWGQALRGASLAILGLLLWLLAVVPGRRRRDETAGTR
jgi:hypothetical protein